MIRDVTTDFTMIFSSLTESEVSFKNASIFLSFDIKIFNRYEITIQPHFKNYKSGHIVDFMTSSRHLCKKCIKHTEAISISLKVLQYALIC